MGHSRDELQVLAEMGGPDYEKLIPQLLYYSVYGTDPAGKHDLKEGMALAGVSDLLKISQNQIATALLPYLGPAALGQHGCQTAAEAARSV